MKEEEENIKRRTENKDNTVSLQGQGREKSQKL